MDTNEAIKIARAVDCWREPITATELAKIMSEAVRLEREACETDAEERRLLAALLREWYEMFAPCRREGTEGASLIDRTALMLQMTDTLKTANDRVEGRDAASSRRVPSHDGLAGIFNYGENNDN